MEAFRGCLGKYATDDDWSRVESSIHLVSSDYERLGGGGSPGCLGDPEESDEGVSLRMCHWKGDLKWDLKYF